MDNFFVKKIILALKRLKKAHISNFFVSVILIAICALLFGSIVELAFPGLGFGNVTFLVSVALLVIYFWKNRIS